MEKEKKDISLVKNLRLTYVLIISLMVIPTLYSIVVFRVHTNRYDKIIGNVTNANQLSLYAKNDLLNEIWEIVSGLKNFSEARPYMKLREIRVGISKMKETTSPENLEILVVAYRTEQTLERYVQKLEFQIENTCSVAQNQEVMEQIRGVTSLLYDVLQDYIVLETKSAESANMNIRRSSFIMLCIIISISILSIFICMATSTNMAKMIAQPIREMQTLSSRIANGDLTARAESPHLTELNELASNLNIMASRIQNLIDENVREQKNLQKAEMRTLQAQITPHFLYNTFDTIIWLAESEEIEDVIEVTRAFSNFFRISLSKGHDWITVAQEIEHVTNYLKIQRIRYENILDYEIDFDETISDMPMLKLLLQPLVENAIYHGIKNKRGRGKIFVQAKKTDSGAYFCVTDTGIGFSPERLEQVTKELALEGDTEQLESVYGLYNVCKRLELYYDKKVSVKIESEYGKGTCVSFEIPFEGKNV